MSNSAVINLGKILSTLLDELLYGSAKDTCWVLNPSDHGLLRSLEMLSSQAASSVRPSGGASIAAHVDHLRYAMNLLNRASRGEDAFAAADFSESWRRVTVSDQQWTELLDRLRAEAENLREALNDSRDFSEIELTGMIAGVVHIGYHFGAMRQIDRSIRGPSAGEEKISEK
jgi:hypothetical protein